MFASSPTRLYTLDATALRTLDLRIHSEKRTTDFLAFGNIFGCVRARVRVHLIWNRSYYPSKSSTPGHLIHEYTRIIVFILITHETVLCTRRHRAQPVYVPLLQTYTERYILLILLQALWSRNYVRHIRDTALLCSGEQSRPARTARSYYGGP